MEGNTLVMICSAIAFICNVGAGILYGVQYKETRNKDLIGLIVIYALASVLWGLNFIARF